MEITDNVVQGIADIARINITKEELNILTDNMKRIVDFVRNRLDDFDVNGNTGDVRDNIKIEHFTNIKNVFREDIPQNHFSPEETMSNAPECEDGFFRVPKVIP